MTENLVPKTAFQRKMVTEFGRRSPKIQTPKFTGHHVIGLQNLGPTQLAIQNECFKNQGGEKCHGGGFDSKIEMRRPIKKLRPSSRSSIVYWR